MKTKRQFLTLSLFFLLLYANAVAVTTPSAALISQAEQGNAKSQHELALIYYETASTVEDYNSIS